MLAQHGYEIFWKWETTHQCFTLSPKRSKQTWAPDPSRQKHWDNLNGTLGVLLHSGRNQGQSRPYSTSQDSDRVRPEEDPSGKGSKTV